MLCEKWSSSLSSSKDKRGGRAEESPFDESASIIPYAATVVQRIDCGSEGEIVRIKSVVLSWMTLSVVCDMYSNKVKVPIAFLSFRGDIVDDDQPSRSAALQSFEATDRSVDEHSLFTSHRITTQFSFRITFVCSVYDRWPVLRYLACLRNSALLKGRYVSVMNPLNASSCLTTSPILDSDNEWKKALLQYQNDPACVIDIIQWQICFL